MAVHGIKSVQEKSIWHSKIKVSIGRSVKKAKGLEENENKLFMAFRRKAKRSCPHLLVH